MDSKRGRAHEVHTRQNTHVSIPSDTNDSRWAIKNEFIDGVCTDDPVKFLKCVPSTRSSQYLLLIPIDSATNSPKPGPK